MTITPNSYGSILMEYNDCHEPGGQPTGGQFCSGDSEGSWRARRDAFEKQAHVRLSKRVGELAPLLAKHLPGMTVTPQSQGLLHTVTVTDSDGANVSFKLEPARHDQPWDRIHAVGSYGGVISTSRWSHDKPFNAKRLAGLAKRMLVSKREYLKKVDAALAARKGGR